MSSPIDIDYYLESYFEYCSCFYKTINIALGSHLNSVEDFDRAKNGLYTFKTWYEKFTGNEFPEQLNIYAHIKFDRINIL